MDMRQQYQDKYYKPSSSDVVQSTVDEILSIAEKKLKKKSDQLSVLDVGSGHGDYEREFAKYVKKVVGIEPYLDAYKFAVKVNRNKKIIYHNTLIEEFNTKEKFDLIICLTVLEHMPNAQKSFKKIYKLMKGNSLMYLTAPNKLWPYENHYQLPFLSWLPLSIANIYVKIMKRGDSYEDSSYSKTYFGLKSFLRKFNWNFDFFIPDSNARYLGCGEAGSSMIYLLVKNFGMKLIKKIPAFWIISKGFIVVIHKR